MTTSATRNGDANPPPLPAGRGHAARASTRAWEESRRYTGTCEEMGPDPAWDARVAATPGGTIVQTGMWAASRNRLGFKSYRIIVNEPDGTPVAGCLMYAKRLGPGIWAGSIPYGPLSFGDQPFSAAAAVRTIVAQARRRGVSILVIQPPEGGWAFDGALAAAGFRTGVPSIVPEATQYLDLTQGENEILAGMSSSRRHLVRKGLRAGFQVAEETDLATFHRLHVATATRQGFTPITRENLQAQYDALAPGAGKLFIARFAGRPAAGIWLTHFAGTVTLKLVGWDPASRPHANDALYWTVIQTARAAGAHTLDFGGFDRRIAELIASGQPPPEGFEKTPSYFKSGFGGRLLLLPRARFAFTAPAANMAFGAVARKILTTSAALQFLQRLRNG